MIGTLKRLRQARSKGRVLLFYVFKQKLNPSYWHIWRTKNRQKWNKIKNIMAPQSRGVEDSKNKLDRMLQRPILEHPKNSLSVVLLVLKFKYDL
jgi:hypothetical protein